jgi:HSP20 family protein
VAFSDRDARYQESPYRRPIDVRYREFLQQDEGDAAGAECTPPMDVLETAESVEIVMDLPGVPAGAIRILFSQGTLVIAGRKAAVACSHAGDAAFHLAERSFGRFARAVRLTGAFDGGRASATLTRGELRVLLPRIEERRGRDVRIEITAS